MINKKELNIANKSYTQKDFASIYPELLELAKKLTNKWDPSTSNESDPGVVLLKLLAFIGDKTNYNIDKNILEAFMPSATQESSMRKLTEMNGYEMGYYNAAVTDITFMYKGKMKSDADGFSLVFPAYETVITGTDSTVTYVLLERAELIERGRSETKLAIEGTLKYLRGTNDAFIQVSNLDDNNRLYFPERFIAVNGIFITNSDEPNNLWDKVDNLNTERTGVKCFKFGFDSIKNLPYVEFPQDIAALIRGGLDIKYIITQGADGNVKSFFLNKLYNVSDLSINARWSSETASAALSLTIDDLVVSNQSAATNGANPETLDQAYNNFKKTVGTFSTLVTPRDYANFIYRLMDSANNSFVSNIQVTDRRTDINYGNNVLTFNELGQYIIANEDTTKITPFNLCRYPLNSTNNNYDSASYYNSFRRKTTYLTDIDNRLAEDDVSVISHNVKLLDDTDIYLYKNYYKLNIKITTIAKVTNTEAESIVDNIRQALYKNFNAREVDYGYEIPFDTIFKVIQQADSRIKNISLDEPEITTKVMKADINVEEVDYKKVSGGESEHVKLLAKNIVAGRISLFDYYTDFQFEFFQSAVTDVGPVIDQLESISTEVIIERSGSEINYELKENEVIQLIGPNLTTKITYVMGVNFLYTGDDIEAGIEYQLNDGETLKINYTDTNDVVRNIKYEEGDIIKTNFNLKSTMGSRATIAKDFNGTPISMYTLLTNETIDIRDFVKAELTDTWKCYWLLDERKNPDNLLFTEGSKEILLTEGEVFLYTDDAMTDLVILGSGTKLTLASDSFNENDWKLDRTTLINKETIEDKGLAAFSIFDWKTIAFTEDKKLVIQEMAIYTFGEGVKVKISEIDDDINNTFQPIGLAAKIEYQDIDDDNFTEVPQYNITGAAWEVRSRLDINMGPNTFQKLGDNHKITLKVHESPDKIPVEKDDDNNTVVGLNIDLQHAGGDDISLKVTSVIGDIDPYAVSAFVYNKDEVDIDFIRDAETDLIIYEIKKYEDEIELPVITLNDKNTLILFYWNKSDEEVTDIELAVDDGTISKYNQTGSNGELTPGLNIIKLTDTVGKLTITVTGNALESTGDTLVIGKVTVINDLNYDRFGFDEADKAALSTALLEKISALAQRAGKDIFYYSAPLEASHLIEVDDLSSPEALFDYNNIANHFTLAEIDVDKSSINVVRSSKV